MKSLVLALLLSLPLHAAQPLKAQVTPPQDPALVVAPAATVPAPPAGDPIPLDVGKFTWLYVKAYTGPMTFDITGGDAVTLMKVTEWKVKDGKPVKTIDRKEYPGILQGTTKTQWVPAPDSPSNVYAVVGESAGVVTIHAWGIQDGEPFKIGTMVISVAGARPPPPGPAPIPTPPIPPKPEPTGTGAWVELIEETGARTLESAAVIGDLKYWKALESKGHALRFYDKDAPDLPKGHYKETDTLPVILIVSKTGTELFRGPLPLPKSTKAADIAAAQAAISKIVSDTTGVK